MILTLMMNIGMFGSTMPIARQEFRFDSTLDGTINAEAGELSVSINSPAEQNITATGNENTFRFNSKPTLTI